MRIVSGTVCPTPLQWVPVLSHIAHTGIRHTDVTTNFVDNIQAKPYLPYLLCYTSNPLYTAVET